MEEKTKFEYIYDGARKQCLEKHPQKNGQDFWEHVAEVQTDMACKLSSILANLTSSNKNERELAKMKVRELVKLGQEINE